MASFQPKKYGLQLLNGPRKPVKTPTAAAVFDSDSSDEEAEHQKVQQNGPTARYGPQQAKQKKQVQQQLEKAMNEDPTVFQYDEVYEDMNSAKEANESKAEKAKGEKVKPKYIEALKKAQLKRKMQEELRIERKVQKERVAEGGEFADKESFVTGAYKKAMIEMQIAREEELRQLAREASDDVMKKHDLSGFYANLLTNNVAMGNDDKAKVKSKDSHRAAQNGTEASRLADKELSGEETRPVAPTKERPQNEDTSPTMEDDTANHEPERHHASALIGNDTGADVLEAETRTLDGAGKLAATEKTMQESETLRRGDKETGRKRERETESDNTKGQYGRRNDEAAVAAARAKALARRAARQKMQPQTGDDDSE